MAGKEEDKKITFYEDEFSGKEVKQEEVSSLIVFRLAKEWYALEILKASEVVKVDKITYLPSSPEHIAGIVDLRWTILSVTDLKKIFGLPAEGLTRKTRIVVVESGLAETGLLVDEVLGVVDVPLDEIDPTLVTIPVDRSGYIDGECKVDDKLIGVLKVEKVLQKGAG